MLYFLVKFYQLVYVVLDYFPSLTRHPLQATRGDAIGVKYFILMNANFYHFHPTTISFLRSGYKAAKNITANVTKQ